MRHEGEFECPRCRLVAKTGNRRNRCPECGAELVSAHRPTEAWVRAYLYESDYTNHAPSPTAVKIT
jgi:hypothetical protein